MKPIIYGLFALIMGPVLTYKAYEEKQSNDRIAKEGIEVQGVPTEGHSQTGRRSSSYKLTVMYPTKGGKPVTHEFKVTRDYFKSVSNDTTITVPTVPVKYLPSDPHSAIIVGGSDNNEIFLWIGPVLFVIGAVCLGNMLRKRAATAQPVIAEQVTA